jgi:hypothetical protein
VVKTGDTESEVTADSVAIVTSEVATDSEVEPTSDCKSIAKPIADGVGVKLTEYETKGERV